MNTLRINYDKVVMSKAVLIRFRGTCAGPEVKGDVSLSRIEGKCFYSFAELHHHDFHTPIWVMPDLEADMNSYVERVVKHVKALDSNVVIERWDRVYHPMLNKFLKEEKRESSEVPVPGFLLENDVLLEDAIEGKENDND